MAGGVAVLIWVLGTAYVQARRRGRNIVLAVVFLFAAAALFAVAAFYTWPQETPPAYPSAMIVGSIVCLALSMAVMLWHGFRR